MFVTMPREVLRAELGVNTQCSLKESHRQIMSEPKVDKPSAADLAADDEGPGFIGPESPCPYLPGRLSRSEAYCLETLDGSTYEALLALGFRRSGRIVYRPRCRACRECRQIRVPVATFQPSRSQRRVMRRNTDVRVTIGRPAPTLDKFNLFRRYLDAQHDRTMSREYRSFVDFLYESPMDTREISYFIADRLVGVSIADRCVDGISSVYMYYDPDFARRSLGTYSILWEIEHCRALSVPYYYLGYYVAGSATMAYKGNFRPFEVLVEADRWAIHPA